MKKFISTILTATILIIANSCRAQEEDLASNINPDNEPNLIYKRGSDSTQVDSTNAASKPTLSDPPPRNGHQW
ncbi:hypothetical protein [Epilithonimonas arachidiradicis]|uniref:Lipoprotein n=1 Tax=Epilithonimonas arachidiradicis TaxID=1617282 RepID=A0A420CL76_9FLAO|nr:hypothetical protein [Epilithonimonas arachidiradicis]RKE79134.1 hypothetical protein BXY58_3399 [Epilithonimonas arachidiradicis]GGG60491.1 hypothetical protein GCM10007332_22720 [Epilithonimonas arachidiradicis]